MIRHNQLQTALEECVKRIADHDDVSVKSVAKKFSVAESSLRSALKRSTAMKTTELHYKSLLQQDQEKNLAQWVLDRHRLRVPVTPKDIKNAATKFVKLKKPEFSSSLRRWYEGFMRRHNLSTRTSKAISTARALALTPMVA